MSNAGNWLKTPIARTLNEFAENKVRSALDLLGQSLPASVVSRQGGIVTVQFLVQSQFTLPNIQVPMIGSEYVRLPIQPGCLGWVMTADAYLGGVSGLGGGTASLTPRANLSMLVWSPIGNKNWSPSDDDMKTVIYGPDGVIIRDQQSKNKIVVDKTAGVTIDVTAGTLTINVPAGHVVAINGDTKIQGNAEITGGLALGGNITDADGVSVYPGDLKTSGGIIAGFGTGGQVGLQTHSHAQPNDSHGDTEAPTAAPTGGT